MLGDCNLTAIRLLLDYCWTALFYLLSHACSLLACDASARAREREREMRFNVGAWEWVRAERSWKRLPHKSLISSNLAFSTSARRLLLNRSHVTRERH